MVTITSRPYSNDGDDAAIHALLVTLCADSDAPLYCTVGDLDWWRYCLDDPANPPIRLWVDGCGAVVGFSWLNNRGEVDLVLDPGHRAIEGEMLRQVEHDYRDRNGIAGETLTLTPWAHSRDDGRQAVLRQRGYQRTQVTMCHRRRSLDGPVPALVLPAGYQVRAVRGEIDVDARVAVHRNAFAPSRMTVAKHRAVMQAPTYRADLDLVVEAPDRTFAAYCIVWFDAVNKIGVFEPVGTHSAHRRRGFATAVLAHGLIRLRALGAHTAYVMSSGDPDAVAANRLYESAGFGLVDRIYAWEKTL